MGPENPRSLRLEAPTLEPDAAFLARLSASVPAARPRVALVQRVALGAAAVVAVLAAALTGSGLLQPTSGDTDHPQAPVTPSDRAGQPTRPAASEDAEERAEERAKDRAVVPPGSTPLPRHATHAVVPRASEDADEAGEDRTGRDDGDETPGTEDRDGDRHGDGDSRDRGSSTTSGDSHDSDDSRGPGDSRDSDDASSSGSGSGSGNDGGSTETPPRTDSPEGDG